MHHIEDATKMLWKGGRRLLLNLGKLSAQHVVEKRVIYTFAPHPHVFFSILYLFCLVYHSFLSMSEDKERNGKNGCNVLIQEFNQLALTWSIQGTSIKRYIKVHQSKDISIFNRFMMHLFIYESSIDKTIFESIFF